MTLARRTPLLGACLAALAGSMACLSDDASSPVARGAGDSGAEGGKPAGTGGRDAVADAPPLEPDVAVPPGARTVTWLHGITDAPWITFCVAEVEDGVEGPLAPEPFPAGGLRYGESVRATDLPGGLELGAVAVRAYVVTAASAGVVRGLDCAAMVARASLAPPDAGADAGGGTDAGGAPADSGAVTPDGGDGGDGAPPPPEPPPPIADIRASALPVLPAAALARDESYLIALGGCLGGPGVTSPAEVSICGVGYAPSRPTLAASVVRLSRETDPERVGIQFLGSTPAFSRTDFRIVPGTSIEPLSIARDVALGALRPARPFLSAEASDLAAGETARVQVSAAGSLLAAYDASLASALAGAGLTRLSDGQSYTFVLLGPTPGFLAEQWWNGPLVTVVKNTD